jgi:hypothetical protein
MSEIPLESLDLKSKWPRLAELQSEVVSLERQLQKASAELQTLERGVAEAKNKDIAHEAHAVRSGKKPPTSTEEPQAQKRLDAAKRNRDVLSKALEDAQTDLALLRSKHQHALYQDVRQARQKIAAKVAEHAKEAFGGFSKYSDLHYLLRDLAPPAPPPDENAPAQRLTIAYAAGVQTTRSVGPDRGHVEQTLQYLVSLAPDEAQGDENAA